jgi:formylglycine-generating enzyme required for sulfatase activity
MLTTFLCPSCSREIEADATLCGGMAACPGCNSDVQIPAMEMGPGVTLGGFRLDEMLGKGGMGEVYRATQLSMEREVALKILPPSMTSNKESVERFLKEARMSAKLDHNNIVTVHDAGEDNGYYYYAMSCVQGESLQEIVERDGPLSEKRALKLTRGVADALDFAWQRHQMMHRDIKPANIMIDEDGSPKILDLGLAKTALEEQGLTMTGMIVGTPYYMSPEQARGDKDLDCQADIYSVGATLYHLLTGTRPFDESGSVMAVLARLATEEPTSIRSIRDSISENCELLVQVMMSKHREHRYPDYQTLIKDIRRVLNGKRPLGAHGNGVGLPNLPQPGAAAATMPARKKASPGAAAPPAPPARKSGKGLWIGLGVGAAALALIGAMAIGGGNKTNPQASSQAPASAPPVSTQSVTPATQKAATPKPTPVAQARTTPAPTALPERRPPEVPLQRAGQSDLADAKRRFEAAVAAGDRLLAQELLRMYSKRMSSEERKEAMKAIFSMPRDGAGPRPGGRGFDRDRQRPEGKPLKNGWKNPRGVAGSGNEPQFGDEDDWNEPATPPAAGGGGEGVINEVRDALLELNLDGAKKLLAQNKHKMQPQSKAEFEVADRVTKMREVILDTFKKQKGAEVPLELRSGEKLMFVPESVIGSKVSGKRIVRKGETKGKIGMSFDVDELSIVERLKRLPPESDPAGAIMRGMEALAAGRPDAAERFFGGSKSKLGEALLAGLKVRVAEAKAKQAAAAAERARSRPAPAGRVELKSAKPVTRPEVPSISKLASGSDRARDQQASYAKQRGLPVEIIDSIGIVYRLVPPGTFVRSDGATVRISRPMYVGKYEITQEQFERVLDKAPISRRGDRLAVDHMSWEHARHFAAELCRKLDLPVGTVRMPTEAEWEYAARAGTSGDTYFDPRRGDLTDFGNFLDRSAPDKYGELAVGLFKNRELDDGEPVVAEVGQYRPNAFGLYDVYGNVFEWTSDWGGDYKKNGGGEVVDPEGPAFGLLRVHRGGSFLYKEDFCNSSKRHQSPAKKYHGGNIIFGNGLGLRLVREID